MLEARSRGYVENRIRAGVLEYGTEQLLNDSGVGERMRREGMLHPGVVMRFGRADHRIDFADLVGKHVMVYGQHKVVQDLIAARLAAGGQIVFEADDVSVHDFQTGRPRIRYRHEGAAHEHRVRHPRRLRRLSRRLPSIDPEWSPARYSSANIRLDGWASWPRHHLPRKRMYMSATNAASHCWQCGRRRSSRLYLQCAPDEDLAAWSDDRIWAELQTRAARDGFSLAEGPILQRGVTADAELCGGTDAVRAACTLPVMPRTSCRRRGRRG